MRRSLIWFAGLVLSISACKPALQPQSVPTVSAPTVSAPMVPTAAPTIAAGPTVTVKSGLILIATVGPTCAGPQRIGQVCTAPYEGEFVVTRPDGSEAVRFKTNAAGRAVVDLPPGDYTVSVKVETGKALPRGGPVEARVVASQYVEVTLDLDTGLR